MDLQVEQIHTLAPDTKSIAAGQKLAKPGHWSALGRNERALWGLCAGSAVYQVRVDLSDLAHGCSCPSRKLPCKHVLGLLYLAAQGEAAVPSGEPLEWVEEWLTKRGDRARSRASRVRATEPVDLEARTRREEKRHARVDEGVELLTLWLQDVIRGGLAAFQPLAAASSSELSRRLVDFQARGLATRVTELGMMPASGSTSWPSRLLEALGELRLLCEAYRRLAELPEALQETVRGLVGWSLSRADLEARGKRVSDSWLVLGQTLGATGSIRVQRSWLLGRETERGALVLQFAPGQQPFADTIVPATEQEATLLFYPDAAEERAILAERQGPSGELRERPPGPDRLEVFLDRVADTLARDPWTRSVSVVLRDVTVSRTSDGWHVRDGEGRSLPLRECGAWELLARTGAHRFDLAIEWDGIAAITLGAFIDGRYVLVGAP